MREYISKNRLRYKMNGFNLDLRFITPNVIVLASPADRGLLGKAARNHADEVRRFFRTQHTGKVMFFNLIGELDAFVFDFGSLGPVNHDYMFLDHQIPGLGRMQSFCQAVKAWLNQDEGNVVALMCRSGRNRCAVMACAYLLYTWPSEFQSAQDAMEYFTWRRMRTGEAVTVPSQKRYISYFAQRFAACPQKLKLSRVVVPVGPLKQDKLRLDIHGLTLGSHKSGSGNISDITLIWSSKGKQMGKVEEGDSYCIFDFPEAIRLTGDVRISLLGRRYANGPFITIFTFWFNVGFVDHSPMVWDLACFDNVNPAWRLRLPDDFHVQTLWADKPRVACSQSKTSPARIFCWDCEDPFMSEEVSQSVHAPKKGLDANGELVDMRSGPRHRYHPLVEEDCALCQHRAMLVEQADGTTMSEERLAELASSSIEAAKRRHDAAVMADFMAAQNNGKAFTTEEGLNLFRLQRSQEIQNRKKELLFYQGKTTSLEDNSPLYGIPTVFCVDTQQFLCSWCNRYGLSKEDRKKLTRFSLPLLDSSDLKYSGCSRQTC